MNPASSASSSTRRKRSRKKRNEVLNPSGALNKAVVRQMIQSAIKFNDELKYADYTTTAQSIDWLGITYPLSDIAQGDSDTTRDGDRILVKNLSWSFYFRYNAQALATSCNVVRLIIYSWKPFYGDIAPTGTKILVSTGNLYSACGPYVHDGRNQFTVLVDQHCSLDAAGTPAVLISGSRKLDHVIQYKAASTTNASGGLYALVISDAVAASGIYVALAHAVVRLNFTDS